MAAENENGLFQTLAPGERETVQERIWDFLAERAGRYAMGESTSLPEETAGELLESVLFCTQKGLAALGKRASWLAGNGEVRQAFSAGLSLVREEARQAAETLSRVREYSWFGSDSRRDAVFRDIPQFFRLYDPEFFACRIPCLIDYPLCLPVRGDGIDYVARYLWGLERESRFCARFPEDRVRALLRRYCPGYERVPLGLFEPVLCNALALVLLGRDPRPLSVPEELLPRLREKLREKPGAALGEVLAKAASGMCPGEGREAAYLARCGRGLAPRIEAVRDSEGLREVFLAF